MNKAELIQHIAEKIGVSKKQAEDMIETFVDTVTATLKAGGEVVLAGFGAFTTKTRKPRMGVNPQRPKEPMKINAVTVAKFKAGNNLKLALKHTGGAAQAEPTPAPTPAAPAEPTTPEPTTM